MAVAKYDGFERRSTFSTEGSFGQTACSPEGSQAKKAHIARERKLNQNFFFSNFSGTPGISRQNPGIFPGFEGRTELFGPHPFVWKTPTPPENIRAQKFRFGFGFRAWIAQLMELQEQL